MGDPFRSARRLQQKAGKVELAEYQAPLVEGVKGMEPGYLIGSTVWGGEVWDVIMHPGDPPRVGAPEVLTPPRETEYSVRQHDKDEDTGFIVRVPKPNCAKIVLEHGFLFSRATPIPKDASGNGVVIQAQRGQNTYLCDLGTFVARVMAMASVTESDEEGEGDALVPA